MLPFSSRAALPCPGAEPRWGSEVNSGGRGEPREWRRGALFPAEGGPSAGPRELARRRALRRGGRGLASPLTPGPPEGGEGRCARRSGLR